MQVSRFVQVILLRDVLMYILPGGIFGFLVWTIGPSQTITAYSKSSVDTFGEFVSTVILIGVFYSLGYFIYSFTNSMFNRIYKLPSSIVNVPHKKNETEKEGSYSFAGIENDLISRVSQTIGEGAIADWTNSLREEIGSDQRGLRYLRYLCEMMVMQKYPDIHHITIERKAALKNFQTSMSGVLILAGGIGVTNALFVILARLPGMEWNAILGGVMMLIGILLFRSLKKMEQELRISIWRAFHAMFLIQKYLDKQETE